MVSKRGAITFVALIALTTSAWGQQQLAFVGGIGAPHDKNLEALLDKNQPDDAARYWGENRSYFWDNAEIHKTLLARLKIAVNTPHEARMNAAEANLKALGAQALPILEWSKVIRTVSEARLALEAYRALPIAIDDTLRSDRFIALDTALGELVDVYVKAAPAAFGQYDHFSGPAFVRVYPVDVPEEVIAAGYLALKPRLETATPDQIVKFQEAYGKILTGRQRDELARLAMQARYRDLVPGGKVTAAVAAKLIGEISAGRMEPAMLPVKLAVYWSKDATKSGEFPVALKAPPAIEIREITRRELPARLAETDVVVFVDADRTVMNRTTRASRQEFSRFKSSERQALNPAYLDAQAMVQQKQMEQMRAESGGGFSFTLDPIALVAGLAKEAYSQAKQLNAKGNLKQAQDQLANTPRMLTEDVMADYQYTIADVEVTRRVPLSIYVIDVKSGGYLKQTTEITERQRFESVDGLHPRDPERDQVLSRFPPAKAVTDYIATPVTVDANSILSAAFATMNDAASQPIAALPQDIDRGAVQAPLATAFSFNLAAGHCDAFFDNFVEQLKVGRCAAEAESLKGFVEAVGGPSRSPAETGLLSTARTPDLYKSVPSNDERWMQAGETAQPNCAAPLAIRGPSDSFMECVRVLSCGARAAACGRELTRQNRGMACPEASQRCMVVYPIPQ
ncbi:MAG TPA: hypothetical protein VM183_10875 [Burkholderiales bacterium]|nr:hypothetical protein [Burkholderiales bacterium]